MVSQASRIRDPAALVVAEPEGVLVEADPVFRPVDEVELQSGLDDREP
jgi:hypothetical protein